ncbi:EamA-like transporter family protein [Pseudodesulfovibrio hydrargyri]|uniref:EamA-like transporter family protein n=1 Tax=Pseudodesulfovibrio hydrargyri TaxID=2125990 RepID=A0A1J5N2S3_9BACT|nr:EamA family transporter [Pseudodesulfovibrio hydrargyri]OIQ49923.1 EamA-like transporter family protein [Pseudodesulfovibrio hydrargyri]
MTIAQLKAFIPEEARAKGTMAAILGGILLSFDPIFVRLSGVGGYETAFLFGLFSALSMGTLIQATDARGLVGTVRESGWPAVVSGLIMLGSASMFVLSIKHTSVANTMMILSGRPVLTAAAAWLILRERTSGKLWLAIGGVVCGMAVVVSGSLRSGNVHGDGLALAGVICLALNGVMWRHFRAMSRMLVVGFGGLFLAVIMFFLTDVTAIPARTWLVMACMGLLSAPAGRVLNAVSSRYIPAAEMATYALISPVLAPIWVFLLFREQPPAATLAGGGLILAAIAAYIAATARRP